MLINRYRKCSINVKLTLFKLSVCQCMICVSGSIIPSQFLTSLDRATINVLISFLVTLDVIVLWNIDIADFANCRHDFGQFSYCIPTTLRFLM